LAKGDRDPPSFSTSDGQAGRGNLWKRPEFIPVERLLVAAGFPQKESEASYGAGSLALAKSASTGQAFKTGVTDRGSQYLRGEFLKFIE